MLLRFFMSFPNCPQCQSEYTYQDGELLICPECSHEWKQSERQALEQQEIIKDANGNVLTDGDSVTVVKDLKIKGSSMVVKVGTKVKTIRLITDASDGHNIDCKIDGIGAMKLKSEFVKKA
jgi:protein PhnA